MQVAVSMDALSAKALKRELVHFPDRDLSVMVRELTGKERDKFEADCIKVRGSERQLNLTNIRARLCAMAIINPDTGARLFADADIATLGDLPASVLDPIFQTAMRLSKMGKGDVEELAKNSEGAPLEE